MKHTHPGEPTLADLPRADQLERTFRRTQAGRKAGMLRRAVQFGKTGRAWTAVPEMGEMTVMPGKAAAEEIGFADAGRIDIGPRLADGVVVAQQAGGPRPGQRE